MHNLLNHILNICYTFLTFDFLTFNLSLFLLLHQIFNIILFNYTMADFQPANKQQQDGISDNPSNSPSIVCTNFSTSYAFELCEEPEGRKTLTLNEIQSEEADIIEKTDDKKIWNNQDEELLLKSHDELGNKWTDIANRFSGKDHNCVKNHFYAQVRKSLRRLNYFLKKYFDSQLKQLNMNHVSKMITMLSQKKTGRIFDEIKEDQVQKLKRFLFEMSKRQQTQQLNDFIKGQIKRNSSKIYQYLETVRKINITEKKLKTKKQHGTLENNFGSLSRTIKIQVKQQNKHESLLHSIGQLKNEAAKTELVDQFQSKSENFMMILLPWNTIENPIGSFMTPMHQYGWVNPTMQNLFCFGGNIFTNS